MFTFLDLLTGVTWSTPRCTMLQSPLTSHKYICGSFHCPCATVEARAKFIGLCAHEIDDSFLKRLKQLHQGPGDVVSYKGETYTKINTMLCIRSWSLAESIVQSYSCTTLFRQVHKPQGKGCFLDLHLFRRTLLHFPPDLNVMTLQLMQDGAV